ncbi:MAG: PRD domain-containing protein [Anaerococcus sp.]|nr:PRD domain-containing protein [Anaerococcus sp.]
MHFNEYEDRQVKILETLENKFLSLNDMEKLYGVSKKTIRSDLKKLNNHFANSAYIHVENGVAKLFIYDYHLFVKAKKKLIEKSVNFSNEKVRILELFDCLMEKNYWKIDDLSEKLFISRSSTIKDLDRLKNILDKYGLGIAGKQNTGIRLRGKEYDIRKFILENDYDYMSLSYELTDEFELELLELLGTFGIFGQNYLQVLKVIRLSINRIRKGFTIDSISENYYKFDNGLISELKKSIKDLLVKSENINPSSLELLYMMTPLMGMRTPLRVKKISAVKVPNSVIDLVDEILQKINNKMDIKVNLGELLEDFTYHIYFLVNRMNLNYEINNPIKDEIKNKYKVAYEMAKISSKVIEEKTNHKISESEMSYLAAYFQLYVGKILNEGSNNKYKLALINSFEISETMILKKMIEQHFPDEFIIDIYDDIRNIKNIEKYDLLISNQQLDIGSYYIYEKDLANCEQVINKINKFKLSIVADFDINNTLNSIIINKVNKELFFFLDGNSYEEDLNYMLNKLIELGMSDEEFKANIFAREEKSTTIFSEEVAFPHAKSNNFIISIGINKKRNPKLIFLVGINSEEDSILLKLYEEIVDIATEEKLLEKINEIESYRDFVESIIKDTNLFR